MQATEAAEFQALKRKEVISCKLDEVFEKLVQKPRGGYCFEQNTLFAAVLRTLNFNLYTAAARYLDFSSRLQLANLGSGASVAS